MADYLTYPKTLTINDTISLRLSTTADADSILTWTQEPAVNAWWESRPLTRQEVEAKYTGKRLPGVIVYIIENDKTPVGIIQAWQDNNTRGLDMFLSANAQGHGLGPTVARALAVDLTKRGWSKLTVDPAIDNLKAIRAWEKAGFVSTGRYGEDSEHKTLIMAFQQDNR